MSAVIIRPALPGDRPAIRALVERAFGTAAEADLVEALHHDGDVVLELVAERAGEVRGHVLFSRLGIESDEGTVDAVALAPLAVDPHHQREGIGTALMAEGHARLQARGEVLSVVLGDPAYYEKAGYRHARAAGFSSDYQGEALQALAFDTAPEAGRLVYPRAFQAL